MTKNPNFIPGCQVKYRDDVAAMQGASAGLIGQVTDSGAPPETSQVFVIWSSGEEGWEHESNLDIVGDETSYRLGL